MVDNILLSKLLDASDNISQIIIVGDSDQLPSVGPGNVLHDLIDSDLINVIKLNKIYRQEEVSNIVKLAHHIKNNEDISEDFENDVTFYETHNTNTKNTIFDYIKLANKKGYTQDDIQVVAPMYSGVNGIDSINLMLQDYFNPKDEFKPGDKITADVLKWNDGSGNVLLSYKSYKKRSEAQKEREEKIKQAEEYKKQKQEKAKNIADFWDNLEVGKMFTGSITKIADYGVFVDLGITNGLAHKSELVWDKAERLEEKFKVNDVIEVKVKSFDNKCVILYKINQRNIFNFLFKLKLQRKI